MKDIFEHDPATRKAPNPYSIQQESKLFERVITSMEVMQRVIAYLISKAMKEKVEQNEYNKSYLGNVEFWIKNTRDGYNNVKKSELAFSETADAWDLEQILLAVEQAERSLMIETGSKIENYKPVINT